MRFVGTTAIFPGRGDEWYSRASSRFMRGGERLSGLARARSVQRIDLRDARRMAAPAETSVEERFDDGDGEPGSNEPATEREHVRVVVLAGVLRRRHVVAHRRANPGDLVRGHA